MKGWMLLLVVSLLCSCAAPDDGEVDEHRFDIPPPRLSEILADSVQEITLDQKASFKALNALQVSLDERNHLYSTFPAISHPCYPQDSIWVISQSDLHVALTALTSIYGRGIPEDERKELVATSVLAQEEYEVWHCQEGMSQASDESGLLMYGTWVLRDVLGMRDVVVVW